MALDKFENFHLASFLRKNSYKEEAKASVQRIQAEGEYEIWEEE